MGKNVIEVRGIGKRYRLGAAGDRQYSYKSLRDILAEVPRKLFRRHEAKAPPTFWALKDISFDVAEGEVVGLIGRNGAGKSTFLKVLSRVTDPTEGRILLHGRIGSLLEVGTGFHPELTGRENIFLNGAVLGMRHAEIDRQFDAIVAFAEVEKFIDTPVKHYSSGMYMRLAFAVAAHLDPDVLLIDEVFAVGDAQFQQKSLGSVGEVARNGRTVFFVSHNMPAVLSLCTRAVLLSAGTVSLDSHPREVADRYMNEVESLHTVDLSQRTDRQGDQSVVFTDFQVLDQFGQPLA